MLKYIVLILFTFIMFSISDLKNILAESQLDIKASTTPNLVTTGQNATVILTLKYNQTNNASNMPITINSIQIKYPIWASQEVLDKPVLLESSRIHYENIPITVPEGASAGTHTIALFINTTVGDYVVSTNLEVERVDEIPLSGNVPLSILVLIYSGSVTYIMIIYILTHKLMRNYLEL